MTVGTPDALSAVDEAARLAEVRRLGLADSGQDERVDQLVRLAADLYEMPVALVTLVDDTDQHFLSSCGIAVSGTSIARDISFCVHALGHDELLVVSDMWEDQRFAANPHVVGEPYVRFYAGAVLRGPSGYPLGTLCLIDFVPRELSAEQRQGLVRIARVVEAQLCVIGGSHSTQARERAVTVDAETGLCKRRTFETRLERMLEGRPPPKVTVVSVHVANTADVRAARGSAAMRVFIRTLAERLQTGLPSQVEIARWDHDEFLFAAPSAVPGCAPDALAQGIAELLTEPITIDDELLRPQITIGIGLAPDDAGSADTLIGLARSAGRQLDGAPSGSSRIAQGQDTDTIQHRLQLVQRLERALAGNAIKAWLQPRVDLVSGRIVGAEALARWHDAELGWVPPEEFIPVAERLGLVGELGRMMLVQIAELLASWRDTPLAHLSIAINAGADEFVASEFPIGVHECLEATGAPPQRLELELTETAMLTGFAAVRDNMEALAASGVRFAVDDFGTGYSSFRYLRELPVHQLKIDRSFVRDIATDANDASIVQAIVALAHALDLEAVAEGVEGSPQLAYLRGHGCDQAQGFHFSAAVPPAEFVRLCRTQ